MMRQKKKRTKHKIEPASLDQVHIVWEDAWMSTGTWTRDEFKKEPQYLLHDSGFLLYEDKEKVVLGAEERVGRESWRYVHTIPKISIRGREIVKKGKHRTREKK